jgi:DNA-binding transcriptional LysR family regulator
MFLDVAGCCQEVGPPTSDDGGVNLNGVDLNLLVALDALLAERNVTRAAQRLSIGQPAMTAALNRLRKLFGDPLLVRSGSEMIVTPLAETLVRPVREAIGAIHSVLAVRDDFDPRTDERTFTVIASDYVGLVLLRPLIGRLAREAPQVRLIVRPVTADFVAQVRRDQVDAAIVPREIAPERVGLSHDVLFHDRYVLAVDAANEAVGEFLTVDEFAHQPHLASGDGSLPALGHRQLEPFGLSSSVEVSTQTSLLAPFLLAGTDMVTLVLERLARQLQHAAGIRIVEPPVPLQAITECLYWSPRRADDPSHRWLRQLIQESADKLS